MLVDLSGIHALKYAPDFIKFYILLLISKREVNSKM